jgi:hypothetical protein
MIVLAVFWKLVKRTPLPRSKTIDLYQDEYVATEEDEADDEKRESRLRRGALAKRTFWKAYYSLA